jgi:TATA-binding protein-associated factor Taf7
MVVVRDEASESGTPMTQEELSKTVLGEKKRYIRGFGVGPRPISYSSRSDADIARQEELEKLRSELEQLREERQREREEEQRRREEEQRQREEEQRQREEEQIYREEETKRRQDAQQREIDELKSFMMKFQSNCGRN